MVGGTEKLTTTAASAAVVFEIGLICDGAPKIRFLLASLMPQSTR